jgi:hypothetical protein
MRAAFVITLSAAAWIAVVHSALQVPLGTAGAFIGLMALAAYGVGYEMEDAGTAAAMFAGLAVAAVFLGAVAAASGAFGVGPFLALGTGPALVAAQSAYAGGLRREACN